MLLYVAMFLFTLGDTAMALCAQTTTGRDFVTDNAGYLCNRRASDPYTKCCPRIEATRYQCSSCVSPEGQWNSLGEGTQDCCATYEVCVSCCMHPSHSEMALEGFRARSLQSPLYTASSFEVFTYCTIRCRTSSASVFHQNKYKTAVPYCFGK